jgi:hypothetical protein
VDETLEQAIRRAAAEFERVINLIPHQLDVSIDCLDVSTVGDSTRRKMFQVRVVSTHPVQIYP